MAVLAFLNFGILEVVVIATVALLLFGGQLPDVMRSLGRAYGRFIHGLNEITGPVRRELDEVRRLPREPYRDPVPGTLEYEEPPPPEAPSPDDAEAEPGPEPGEDAGPARRASRDEPLDEPPPV